MILLTNDFLLCVQDLMAKSVVFSRLIEEYGSLEAEEAAEVKTTKKRTRRKESKDPAADDSTSEEVDPKKADNAALMQMEERNTGAVTWTVYRDYLRYAGGIIWAPFILFLLTVTQAAQGKKSSAPDSVILKSVADMCV